MEVGVRLIGALQLLISLLLWPYHKFVLGRSGQKPLPPFSSPLLRTPAVEIARKIRRREVKSREVVEAFIGRLKDVNPLLNGLVEERFQAALHEADRVDSQLAAGGSQSTEEELEARTPLLGVPFTVKESVGLKGLSQCVGSVPRRGLKAVESGASVKRLIEAGAIPLCVTNTPEFCMSWETSNNVTGITRNPYDLNRTSGGSSGGEGAFIASGASLLGVGSDIAGSIRIPSMYNGIYGHKPSPGLISIEGHFPNSTDINFNNFLVCGPMARYVDDLKLAFKIMCGENAANLRLDENVDISKLRVFYKEDAGFSLVAHQVDWEIKRGIREAAQYLKNTYNCKIEVPVIKELEDTVEISVAVFLGMEGIPNILDASEKIEKGKGNLYAELYKSFSGESEFSLAGLLFMLILKHNLFIPKSKYPDYCEQNEALRKKFNKLLKDDGVFIYPTYPVPALFHNQSFARTAGIMYTMIFNTLQLPVTHVPIGLDRHGLPIGFQVVAGEKQDRLCLAVAKALEAKFGGWVPPPTAQSVSS